MRIGVKISVNELIGTKKNRLTIIGESERGKNSKTRFLVKCECGNEFSLVAHSFLSGRTTSCGCLKKEMSKIRPVTHGLKKHPLYTIWSNIKGRCTNPYHKSYPNYGGKGISICKEWSDDFKIFYDWCMENGWKRGLDIDKDIIPKKLGVPPLIYSPEMCSIVTRKENMNSTSANVNFLYNGELLTLSQISEKENIKYKRLQERVKRGWDINKSISEPLHN